MPHFGFYLMTYFSLTWAQGSINYPKLSFLRSIAKIVPSAKIYCRPLPSGKTPLLEEWVNGELVFRAPEYSNWLYVTHEALKHTIVKYNYDKGLIEYYAEK